MIKSLWRTILSFGFLLFFVQPIAAGQEIFAGNTALAPFRWTGPAQVQAGSSPDNSHELFLSALSSAKNSIYLEAYMLRSGDISETILGAAKRGVRVEILLDGWTVGKPAEEKIDQIELYYANKIVTAGGRVTYMKSETFLRNDRRFRFIHSKFAVIDETIVFISSENFVNSGFSPTKDGGNRGWVVSIKSPEVAKAYLNVFKNDILPSSQFDDLAPYGSLPSYTLKDPNFLPVNSARPGTYKPYPSSTVRGTISFERILSPEDSGSPHRAILGAIDSAETSLDIQSLSFSPHWGTNDDNELTNPSPLAEAVLAAARRGVRVRALLNPLFFLKKKEPTEPLPQSIAELFSEIANTWEEFQLFNLAQENSLSEGAREIPPPKADTKDNKALIEYFRKTAQKENLDISANFLFISEDKLRALHNKGMIIDGKKTLISSINWVENSIKNNREVAVLIDSPDVANYYAKIFDIDWNFFRNQK